MWTATTVAAVAATLMTSIGLAQATPGSSSGDTFVTIQANGVVHAPRAIRPGRSHVVVAGAPGQALELVAPRGHQSVAALVADYRRFAETGRPARTERDFRFSGGALTGADVYLDLAPGRYYAFDAAGSTLTPAHVSTIDVTGRRHSSPRPRLTGSITAIGHDRWAPAPQTIGQHGYLLFTNASRGTHLVNLLQLKPGVTLADVKAELASANPDPSKLSTGVYDETGVLSPRGREFVSYSLPPGTYAVLDLWPDATTGRPQATLGMVRLIHVDTH